MVPKKPSRSQDWPSYIEDDSFVRTLAGLTRRSKLLRAIDRVLVQIKSENRDLVRKSHPLGHSFRILTGWRRRDCRPLESSRVCKSSRGIFASREARSPQACVPGPHNFQPFRKCGANIRALRRAHSCTGRWTVLEVQITGCPGVEHRGVGCSGVERFPNHHPCVCARIRSVLQSCQPRDNRPRIRLPRDRCRQSAPS
jgi:hypothetical protein